MFNPKGFADATMYAFMKASFQQSSIFSSAAAYAA